MFDAFYNVIRPKLIKADVQVLFSDTDSFCLKITSKPQDKLDVFEELRSICDFSNYPAGSPRFSKQHASKLGYWKSE
jgi:hypothetical protein